MSKELSVLTNRTKFFYLSVFKLFKKENKSILEDALEGQKFLARNF